MNQSDAKCPSLLFCQSWLWSQGWSHSRPSAFLICGSMLGSRCKLSFRAVWSWEMRQTWVFSRSYHIAQMTACVHHLAKCQWSIWGYLPCYNCNLRPLALVEFCLPPLLPSTLEQESRWQSLVVRTAEGLEGGNSTQFFLWRAVETSLSRPEKRRGLVGGKKGDGKAGKEAAGRHFLKADPPAMLKASAAHFFGDFFFQCGSSFSF